MPRTVSASVVKASEPMGKGVRGGSVYVGVIARRRVADGAGCAWPGHLDMTLHKISSMWSGIGIWDLAQHVQRAANKHDTKSTRALDLPHRD
jgi:hypothetical protein